MDDNPFDSPFSDTSFTSSSISPSSGNLKNESDQKKFNELFDKLVSMARPDAEGLMSGNVLRLILTKSNISMKNLKDIWGLADEKKRGSLSKEELKRAMQLIALAQQGKPVTLEELRASKNVLLPIFYELESLSLQNDSSAQSSSEVTSPSTTSNSHTSGAKLFSSNAKYPAVHYQELLDRETVKMDVPKEKGGGIIKYTKYIVKSERLRTEVVRRYSDFTWLQDILLKYYPFRLIPQLPPKSLSVNEDDQFIESRRRGLIRFLEFLGRHPVFREDANLNYFLTETNLDTFAQQKKVKTTTISEEFYSSPINQNPKKHIPVDAEDHLKAFGEKLPSLSSVFSKLVDIIETIYKRAEGDAVDFTKLGNVIEGVIEGEYPAEWLATEKGYKVMKDRMESIGRVYVDISQVGNENIVENLKHHLGMINSFIELLQRRSQTTQKEYYAVAKRLQSNKEKLSSLTAKSKVGKPVDTLVQQIEKDEQDANLLQHRDDFATYCLYQEMIHFNHNKAFVSVVLKDFIRNRIKTSDQLLSIWRSIQPFIDELPITGF